jgi:hypothetical protein
VANILESAEKLTAEFTEEHWVDLFFCPALFCVLCGFLFDRQLNLFLPLGHRITIRATLIGKILGP